MDLNSSKIKLLLHCTFCQDNIILIKQKLECQDSSILNYSVLRFKILIHTLPATNEILHYFGKVVLLHVFPTGRLINQLILLVSFL